MMVINKFHSDHEEAIRYKSTTLKADLKMLRY